MEWVMKELQKIQNKQLEEFKNFTNKYSNKIISRKIYVVNYLKIFLGDYFEKKVFELNDQKFNDYCHNVIDNISLCGPEIEGFHKIVDLKVSNEKKYIEDCIKLYHGTEDLKNCQLGSLMLKCLETSKGLFITE